MRSNFAIKVSLTILILFFFLASCQTTPPLPTTKPDATNSAQRGYYTEFTNFISQTKYSNKIGWRIVSDDDIIIIRYIEQRELGGYIFIIATPKIEYNYDIIITAYYWNEEIKNALEKNNLSEIDWFSCAGGLISIRVGPGTFKNSKGKKINIPRGAKVIASIMPISSPRQKVVTFDEVTQRISDGLGAAEACEIIDKMCEHQTNTLACKVKKSCKKCPHFPSLFKEVGYPIPKIETKDLQYSEKEYNFLREQDL